MFLSDFTKFLFSIMLFNPIYSTYMDTKILQVYSYWYFLIKREHQDKAVSVHVPHRPQVIPTLPWNASSSSSGFSAPSCFSLILFPLPLPMWCFLPFLKYVSPVAPSCELLSSAVTCSWSVGAVWSWLYPTKGQPWPLLMEATQTGLSGRKTLQRGYINTINNCYREYYFLQPPYG